MSSNVCPDAIKLYTRILKQRLSVVDQIDTDDGIIIRLFDRFAPEYNVVCFLEYPRAEFDGVTWADWQRILKIDLLKCRVK